MKVTALAGGVGAAKLLVGLDAILEPSELTVVVNTGDDDVIYGVHVSPDIDICTYWLAGIADTDRGWGIRNDTFEVVDALARFGHDAWFRLGDRDLATCMFRTARLAAGATLSQASDEISRALGVAAPIRPVTDDVIRTVIDTVDGRTLGFQEYFVKERTEPEVAAVRIDAVADARPAPGVVEALADADVVVVCPSNPFLSVGPILSVPGIRETLRAHDQVVAISPIVAGAAIKGPADRLMARLAGGSRASEVARLYADFCDVFVVDARDAAEARRVEPLGPIPLVLDTVMSDHDASTRLAKEILAR